MVIQDQQRLSPLSGTLETLDWTCLFCDAPLGRERHHGERNVFYYDCAKCLRHYYASMLVVQLWPTRTEDERARIRGVVERANAKHKTPHLSPL